jgi:hypothetical protein
MAEVTMHGKVVANSTVKEIEYKTQSPPIPFCTAGYSKINCHGK